MAHASHEFTLIVQHNYPPILPMIPFGVQLVVPLSHLASLFILDHGIYGRSVRVRLISPSKSYKLDRGATVPAHKRYMLDEYQQPVLLYPWHQNDHFDLLGILQVREVVAHVPSSIRMEDLVDWGARLKDAAASMDGTIIQVLFDNVNTGRVSQLQDFPIESDLMHSSRYISRSHGQLPRHHDYSHSISRTYSGNTTSDESNSGLTFYSPESKEQRSESSFSDNRTDEESYWKYRRRVLRPDSPRRYYRPKGSHKYYTPTQHKKHESKPQGRLEYDDSSYGVVDTLSTCEIEQRI